jgi:hypothetical protein
MPIRRAVVMSVSVSAAKAGSISGWYGFSSCSFDGGVSVPERLFR